MKHKGWYQSFSFHVVSKDTQAVNTGPGEVVFKLPEHMALVLYGFNQQLKSLEQLVYVPDFVQSLS